MLNLDPTARSQCSSLTGKILTCLYRVDNDMSFETVIRLYADLRRTIYGTLGIMQKYVKTGVIKYLSLRSLNQDTNESVFSQLRQHSGDNRNLNVAGVDAGMSELRAEGLKEIIRS